MGKENPQAVSEKSSPRGIFFERFKATVVIYEPGEWKRVANMSAEEVYRERKSRSESRVRAELSDQEYVEEWLLNPNLGKQAAYELGFALGAMMADEKNDQPAHIPQNHTGALETREFALRD
jgi:hypothetical protein